ncbi:hypothetical protein C482_13450 [Natrialba chahannaoensis JCM 10990]|uniref:GINS subunit domain-containing protein n=1 Tax=Natrialba chahannaoensis JCM 10990 TaxID=1227492 RepID=M0AFK3_9EURY|nr:hypothetical protein [Natrialba chahannaoensis]ELY97329.1 hypothetical protein C482_13450 [Natrialba chahannaoensis JCM 10990]
MNLNELRSVQSKERKKDSLQNLRPSFYQEVGEYIAELEDERERVADRADDPFSSPEVGRLTDEIETAKDVVEAIYERRMGKLVKQASLAAAGMAANDEGLTAEEADLFDDLVERISSNKSRVLDVLEGVEDVADEGMGAANRPSAGSASDSLAASAAGQNPQTGSEGQLGGPPHETGSAPEPPSPETEPEPEPETEPEPPTPPAEPSAETDGIQASSTETDNVSPADVMGGADALDDIDSPSAGAPTATPEPPADSSTPPAPDPEATEVGAATETDSPDADAETGMSAPPVDRVTVKITEDVGAILGVDDREYTLASDDIVTLPEANATPLVEREAAEQLE